MRSCGGGSGALDARSALRAAGILPLYLAVANRLAHEPSPYLLQHKDNPVDWYPWGEEAFARARAEDKPIFLSIGYSTCHWCHVMEHESFETQAVADALEPRLRLDQGRPRGAAGRRRHLHAGRADDDGQRRLAALPLPDARRRSRSTAGRTSRPTSRWGRPGFLEILASIARGLEDARATELESSAGEMLAHLGDDDDDGERIRRRR